MNTVILTGKYNKEYHLHVVRQFCMLCKTLSLFISLRVRRRVMRLHTRVYGTSNTGALSVHSEELKKKKKKNTDRLTESETLKRSVVVFGELKYICAKLIYLASNLHTGE